MIFLKINIKDKFYSNTLKYPNRILIFSIITAIISCIISILALQFSLKTKIIIALSIIVVILFFDVITLYIKQYEYYYEANYLNKIYSLIDINLNNLFNELDTLKNNLDNTKIEISNLQKIQENIENNISLINKSFN